MKGKRPNRVNEFRAGLLADKTSLHEYVEQRLISQLGGIIDRVLEERHLTQTGLAKAVGMHQPDLNALIRGRAEHVPTLPTLQRLAKGLDVHLVIEIDPSGAMQIRQDDSGQGEKRDEHWRALGLAG